MAGFVAMIQAAERTYCTRRHADVVVLQWAPRSVFVVPAMLRARLGGMPIVRWGHGSFQKEKRWWRDHPDQLARFRSERGLDRGPVIFFVTRLSPPNRVDLLVRATAELSADFPGHRTAIIGNRAVEKNRRQLLDQELGAGNNVVFEDERYAGSMFTHIGRFMRSQGFFDTDYFTNSLQPFFEVRSTAPDAYGFQTAVLLQKR